MLVGHYRALLLTGTERVLDGLLDGAMKRTLDLGVYPSDPGTHRIFINTYLDANKAWLTPRPAAVIVAGLDPEGKLQAADLVRTVRQAVIGWAERMDESGEPHDSIDLAATLLGSGGAGVTAGQAAQLIAQGVYEANTRLAHNADRAHLPLVRELRFVELYLDRASEAWRSLKMYSEANPGQFNVTEPVLEGAGWLPRPLDSGYRGAEYDFIKAEIRRDVEGHTSIAYALDTRRARTEIRAQATQSGLLRNLIATASTDQAVDEQIGRTLFQLLIPLELESFLSGSADMQIEVDAGTAGIPWELLDDSDPGRPPQAPWAIRSKLLRKFRTENFRQQVRDADTLSSVLVIGEPECPPEYGPLPGARQEAVDVFAALTSGAGLDRQNVTALFSAESTLPGPDARSVINALFERDWRVIHIAGHGTPTGPEGGAGGVVLSNDTFLGASEIKAMRAVPELVFVNCCYVGGLGARSVLRTDQERRDLYDRTLFASSVAEALINIGVRCVVAAGWAIDDAAAGGFAKAFYRRSSAAGVSSTPSPRPGRKPTRAKATRGRRINATGIPIGCSDLTPRRQASGIFRLSASSTTSIVDGARAGAEDTARAVDVPGI
jgi:CHAT domain-containing protein